MINHIAEEARAPGGKSHLDTQLSELQGQISTLSTHLGF